MSYPGSEFMANLPPMSELLAALPRGVRVQLALEGREPSLQAVLRCYPRPVPNPQTEFHLNLFERYTRTQLKLERLEYTAVLSSEHLRDAGIFRGPELNVDDAEPLDIETRYFKAGPASEAARYIRSFKRRGEKWPAPVPESEWRLDVNGRRIPDPESVKDFSEISFDMIKQMEYSNGAYRWTYHPHWRFNL
ncbi:hypothetical protein PT974_05835 [Cladobotryum mycophilum]|uniref:Uncharacterized protein n=1 Tax=Cladobotryum mycophilum TaxID=491253 RepID=A0ABR0SKU7_9HYPO